MKIAIVGYGVENQSVYRYFQRMGGQEVTICDQNENAEVPVESSTRLGPSYLEDLDSFDMIVRTPGMNRQTILDKNPNVSSKITTAVNIFFENNITPTIGVTGTKGKGTTSTLISKILEASGKKVVLCGNIGTPMLDKLEEAAVSDYVVMELSSFQLSDVRHSPETAVCLMVVPEHLNWHSDLNDYISAKQNIFKFQLRDNVTIHNSNNQLSARVANIALTDNKLSYDSSGNEADCWVNDGAIYFRDARVCEISDIALIGSHNIENVCAAICATYEKINGNVEAIKSVVTTFTGLPLRLEFTKEVEGVKYYNDSFSTTPETAIAAIRSFPNPKVVILGGADKGVPFDELADAVIRNNVKHVIAIGERGPVIASLLRDRGYNAITEEGLDNMQSIVLRAKQFSSQGDIVLLSPACASFGMFRDYKDRGAQFTREVEKL